MSRRLQWGGEKYDVTHLNNSQGRHQGRTNSAREVAGATELWTVAPNIGGSWVRNLVHVNHLAPGLLRWLLRVWKICAPLVYSWQKGCWAASFDCISGPPGCMARNSLCVSHLAYPQEHTLDEMQIPCSVSCAGFDINVSSDEGVTHAENFSTQLQGNYI